MKRWLQMFKYLNTYKRKLCEARIYLTTGRKPIYIRYLIKNTPKSYIYTDLLLLLLLLLLLILMAYSPLLSIGVLQFLNIIYCRQDCLDGGTVWRKTTAYIQKYKTKNKKAVVLKGEDSSCLWPRAATAMTLRKPTLYMFMAK
jgi:hypothetical protein